MESTRGADWKDRPAPQMVMAPSAGFQYKGGVDAFVAHHITDMGFTGVLRYLQHWGVGDEDIRLALRADQLDFWVHFLMYGDVQAGTAPSEHRHTSYVTTTANSRWSLATCCRLILRKPSRF